MATVLDTYSEARLLSETHGDCGSDSPADDTDPSSNLGQGIYFYGKIMKRKNRYRYYDNIAFYAAYERDNGFSWVRKNRFLALGKSIKEVQKKAEEKGGINIEVDPVFKFQVGEFFRKERAKCQKRKIKKQKWMWTW